MRARKRAFNLQRLKSQIGFLSLSAGVCLATQITIKKITMENFPKSSYTIFYIKRQQRECKIESEVSYV